MQVELGVSGRFPEQMICDFLGPRPPTDAGPSWAKNLTQPEGPDFIKSVREQVKMWFKFCHVQNFALVSKKLHK